MLFILPEMVLAGGAVTLLLLGVFRPYEGHSRRISMLAAAVIATAFVIELLTPGTGTTAFGLLRSSPFVTWAQLLILISAAVVAIMMAIHTRRAADLPAELPVLLLLSTTGMLIMVAADHLLMLYLGLELHSLPLYVLVAARSGRLAAREAGLKYFALGVLSSAILLYGISLIYGACGVLDFPSLARIATADNPSFNLLVIGITCLLAGLAFKISAAPFHMWTPDVYEGAPTSVTMLLASASKVAAVALLIRCLAEPFAQLSFLWQELLTALALLSMIVGALGALGQTNIKRLLAFSAIGNVGYMLIGLAAATPEGFFGTGFYLIAYLLAIIGLFTALCSMQPASQTPATISDLAGTSVHHPLRAALIAIFLFSASGLPPFAGFFGKLFVFRAAVAQNLWLLAIFGVITSVVAAFYYLRIVKIMYFDPPDEPILQSGGPIPLLVMAAAAALLIAIVLQPQVLVGAPLTAALIFHPS